MKRIAAAPCLTVALLLAEQSTSAVRADTRIGYATDSPQVNFVVDRLAEALRQVKAEPVLCDLANPGDKDIVIVAVCRQRRSVLMGRA